MRFRNVILGVCLIASLANGEDRRIWSNGAYGKVDPREYLPESLYTNCVAWYCMNQNPAQFATWGVPDGGAANNSGTQSAANSRPAWTNLAYGSLTFDRVDDYIVIPKTASIAGKTSASLMGWVYRTSNADAMAIFVECTTAIGTTRFGVYSSGTSGFQLVLRGSSSDPSGASITTTSPADKLPLNTWTHIAATANSETDRIYLYANGVCVATNTAAFTAFATSLTTNITMGCLLTPNVQSLFGGRIDAFSAYKSELSASDVNLNYSNTISIHP